MFTKPGRKMDEHNENPNKKMENIRKKSGLKNIITEMKNTAKRINNRLEHTEQIRDLEDKIMEIKQSK